MLDFLIGIFVTWRLTALFLSEDGPFDSLAKFRDALGVRYNEHSIVYGRNEVAKAFTCFRCLSFWVGLLVSALQGQTMLNGLFLGFAYSGAAILLERAVSR